MDSKIKLMRAQTKNLGAKKINRNPADTLCSYVSPQLTRLSEATIESGSISNLKETTHGTWVSMMS